MPKNEPKNEPGDKNKPLVEMTEAERDVVFMEGGRPIYEEMLKEARGIEDRRVSLIAVVLTTKTREDHLVCTYEEYGDEDNVELCEEIRKKLVPFLRPGQALDVVVYDVDLSLGEVFEFPSLESLESEDGEGRRRYGMLRDVRRDHVTIIVTWLVQNDSRRVFAWDVDQGDGAAMYEDVLPTIKATEWNKLLRPEERLEVVSYDVPMLALKRRKA